MPTLTIEYRDENERLALEQAVAYVTQLQKLALTAPAGSVLAICEQQAVADGRTLMRQTLSAALNSRIVAGEQKGGAPAVVRRRTPGAPRDDTPAPS